MELLPQQAQGGATLEVLTCPREGMSSNTYPAVFEVGEKGRGQLNLAFEKSISGCCSMNLQGKQSQELGYESAEPEHSSVWCGGKTALFPALASLLPPHTRPSRECFAELFRTHSPCYKDFFLGSVVPAILPASWSASPDTGR